MQKLSDKKIKSSHRADQNASGPSTPKKGSTFFSFFTSPKAEARGKNIAVALKEPLLKSPPLNVPRANLNEVRNWVALEEKIVHDYKEHKMALPKSAAPAPQSPVKRSLPAFETFTTQTAVSLSPSVSKLKDPLRSSKRSFSGVAGFLLVCGWLAAGAFIFVHIQGTFSSREISQKLTQLQSGKDQLEQSYAALKNTTEDQSAKMQWLNGQLRDMALELKTAKADKIAYGQSFEKKYREELMRITVRYESELAALRNTVETQKATVAVLKAQNQVFENIVDQAGLSALSGAAAGFSKKSFLAGETSILQGKVTAVNEQQRFVVIGMGADQGVSSGRWITISRGGISLAVGRIDRVYPTMSVAVLRSAGMLQMIQEGDSVSFS